MPAANRRLLIIRLADLGDVLTATPALRALHETFPGVFVDVLTSAVGSAVLAGNPAVADVIVADRHLADSPLALLNPRALASFAHLLRRLRRHRYDSVLLLHHLSTAFGAAKWRLLTTALRAGKIAGLDNGRGSFLDPRVTDRGFGALHEVEYALEVAAALGAGTADRSLALTVPKAAREDAARLLAEAQPPLLAIHPGAGSYSEARRWPAERFAALADALAQRSAGTVVLVGTATDHVADVRAAMQSQSLDLSGRTSLTSLAAVLQRCALFVGGDSGVMHVAAAVGVPMVAIFGPVNAGAWGPWQAPESGGGPLRTLVGECPEGRPCLYTGHLVGPREGCPQRYCLMDVTVERVLDAIGQLGVL